MLSFLAFSMYSGLEKKGKLASSSWGFFYLEVKTEMLGNPAWLEGNLALY